jgi:FAD/FMN-containing dehydrogenase
MVLRLIPKPPVVATLRATFPSVGYAVDAVMRMVQARVVPSTIEIVDGDSLEAVARALGVRALALAPEGTAAMLIVEVDGLAEQVAGDADRVAAACTVAGATEVLRARNEEERLEIWRVRREISPALLTIADLKINNDVVVPKGRLPEFFAMVGELKARFDLPIPCFGHAGDGNIHVNIMVSSADAAAVARAREAEGELFRRVIALEGSISGEHGIGFTKAHYLDLEIGPDAIALMRRIKAAFEPRGILNPGKIFPDPS